MYRSRSKLLKRVSVASVQETKIQESPMLARKTVKRVIFFFSQARRHSFIALGVVSRPSCAANQPVGLTHFPASSVTLRMPETHSFSHDSHLFLPGLCVIITDLPAPLCWKQAGRILIFHYGTMILQICHRT